MSEPIDQATIDCWRTNYGLDGRTPLEAAQWWQENMRGFAPSGCVAALGVALAALDEAQKHAAYWQWFRDNFATHPATVGLHACETPERLEAHFDAAMRAAP